MDVRIPLISDLHLEDVDHAGWSPPPVPEFDALACAGYIVESNLAACVDAIARLAGGKPAVMALGNHDRWNLTPRESLAAARGRNPGVHVLEGGKSATLAGASFAGGTLWSDPDC